MSTQSHQTQANTDKKSKSSSSATPELSIDTDCAATRGKQCGVDPTNPDPMQLKITKK